MSEMRRLLDIITEGKLPPMPSRSQLNALSMKLTGRSIDDTHIKNWLYEVEPMTLRMVIAANLGFLPEMIEDTLGQKSGFIPFDYDTMYTFLSTTDEEPATDEHLVKYASPELERLLESNDMDNVRMIDLGNNTIIMMDSDTYFRYGTDYAVSSRCDALFYHGDPQKVISFLKEKSTEIVSDDF